MKQLQVLLPSLHTLNAKMSVRARSDEVYKKSEGEIAKMVAELDKFLGATVMAIAEAEDCNASCDVDVVKKLAERVEALFRAAEHHLGGARVAKQRFQSMLA